MTMGFSTATRVRRCKAVAPQNTRNVSVMVVRGFLRKSIIIMRRQVLFAVTFGAFVHQLVEVACDQKHEQDADNCCCGNRYELGSN